MERMANVTIRSAGDSRACHGDRKQSDETAYAWQDLFPGLDRYLQA